MDIKQKLSIPFRKTKKMFLTAYYNILDSQFPMTYLYIIIILIEYFQHVNLIQFNILYSTPNERIHETYPNIASTLIKMRRILLFYPASNYKATRIVISVLLALFLLQILIVVLCKQIDITKPKPLYQSVLYTAIFFLQVLYIHVLTVPILITLFSVYQCTDTFMLNYADMSCEVSEYILIITLSSITFFCFGIISLSNTFFFKDVNPLSKCPFASANRSNRFLSLLLEIALSIFYIVSPLMNYIKMYVVFFICLVKFIVRFFNMNFYNRLIGWLFMTFDTGELFLSVTSILSHYGLYVVTIHNTVLELIVAALLGVSINAFIWRIRRRILLSPLSMISSNYQVMTKIVMLIDYASDFNANEYKRNVFMGLLHYHRFNCLIEGCKCEAYTKVLNKHKRANMFKQVNRLEDNVNENEKEAVIDGNVERTFEELGEEEEEEAKAKDEENTNLRTVMGSFALNYEMTVRETEASHKANAKMVNTATNDRELSEADCLFGFIKLNIDVLLAKRHSLMLNMVLSYIMKNNLLNHFKGLFEMMKLMKKSQVFFNEFFIFSFKARIEKTIYDEYRSNINQNLSIETVLEYNVICNKIIDDMKEISQEMAQFWGIITFSLRKTPSPKELRASKVTHPASVIQDSLSEEADIYSCAIKASRNIEKLKKMYEKMLMNKHFINKKVLYIYIMFLLKVIASNREAERVKERLTSYETEHNSIFEQLSYQNDELYRLFRTMDRVGILIISGDILSIGKILSVNHQFSTIFNYPKDEISSNTVNKIVPSFISQYHDEFMYRFLETSKKHILNKLRIIFGLSKEGLLIPVYLYVKVIPDLSQSVRFIGILKELNKEHPFLEANTEALNLRYEMIYPKPCFMLVNQKGDIFGVNKVGLKKFGIPLNLLHITNDNQDAAISVQSIFPGTNIDDEAVHAKIGSDEGLIMKLDSKNIKHLFKDYKESLVDSASPILKVMSKMDDDEVFKEHFVYCHSFQLCFNEGQVPVQILKIVLIQRISEDLLEDEDYLNMSMEKRRLRVSRKKTLLKFSNADYLDTSTNDNETNRTMTVNNQRQYLLRMKNKITSYSIPKSIKSFALMICLFLFIFLVLAMSEYFLVTFYSKRMIALYDAYIDYMIRNFYFALTLLDFRYLTLIDNAILPKPAVEREQLISLLMHDLNRTLAYNHKLTPYLTYLMLQYPGSIDFNPQVDSMVMGNDLALGLKEEQAMYVMDYLLVRLVDLLLSSSSLALPHVSDLFYFNTHIAHYPPPENSLKALFYINENGLRVIRFDIERMAAFFDELNRQYQRYMSIDLMIYICIPPFGVVAVGFALFYLLLKKVANYKMTILRIFYLIDRKYGVEAMKECLAFISDLENSVAHLEKFHEAFTEKRKVLKTEGILKELKDSQAHSSRSRNTKNVMSAITNVISDNAPSYNNTSDKLFEGTQSENTSSKPLNISIDNEQRYIERSIAFWRFEKGDDEMANAIKAKKDYMVRQLNKAKSNFWSHLCMVYLNLIVLFVIVLIFTSVAIGLNNEFKEQGMRQASNIHNICYRGWSFVNLLLFSWEIVIANSITPSSSNITYSNHTLLSTDPNLTAFDIYSLYLNQTDAIETYILFLSTMDLVGSDKAILGDYSQMETDLNTELFCSLLETFDVKFYKDYQEASCAFFYLRNKGLKDHIKIVYFQIKNNFPLFDPSDLDGMIRALNAHEAFVYDSQVFTSRAMLMELSTFKKSIVLYGDDYKLNCLIRLMVFVAVIVLEAGLWGFVIYNLIQILNKDKAILTLLPFESLIMNDKLIDILKEIARN